MVSEIQQDSTKKVNAFAILFLKNVYALVFTIFLKYFLFEINCEF